MSPVRAIVPIMIGALLGGCFHYQRLEGFGPSARERVAHRRTRLTTTDEVVILEDSRLDERSLSGTVRAVSPRPNPPPLTGPRPPSASPRGSAWSLDLEQAVSIEVNEMDGVQTGFAITGLVLGAGVVAVVIAGVAGLLHSAVAGAH